MNPTEPILSVRDLQVHFELSEGCVRAVEDVSFDVVSGRTVALVGESGCGKSVTARAILNLIDKPGRIVKGAVLLRSDDGGATVDTTKLGADSRRMRAIRGGAVGLIFQEPMTSFSPVHTIGSQIVEAIRLHRPIPRARARAEAAAWLAHTGVPEPAARLRSYPHELSGGQLQRAMIAMALSCRPRILIADEPTTALDVTTQAQILALLKKAQAETHMAIIFITHDLGVVAEMADEVVVMYLGEVVEKGSADAVFHAARHPYTAAMMRSIPHLRTRASRTLHSIAGAIPHPLLRPRGCAFHDRCPDAMPGRCDRQSPATRRVAPPDHVVKCFLYDQEDRP